MIDKKTFIFIGNSGCGKGTQANLLENILKKEDDEILHIELGNQFRHFLSMTTYTSQKAKKVAKKGQLQPEFLAIKLWSEVLNLHYSPEKHLILDGTPRTIREAYVLDAALDFYKIKKPIVIYLKTSKETAEERMLSRKRKDDTEEKIKNRLKWFVRDVFPVIEFFKNNNKYYYLEISGESDIETIHKKIISKVF